jgi:hypothetical protein
MAREVRTFEVTVPAGTLEAAPFTAELSMPARIVRSVRVRIPPGPAGVMGWALGAAGERVLPWNPGAWIIGDNEAIEWPLEGQIESGAWQLQAYNTGVYDHSLYLTFLLEPLGEGGGPPRLTPLELGP